MPTDHRSALDVIDEIAAEIGWRSAGRFLDRLRPYNLTPPQFLVVQVLARSGQAESIRSLCDQLLIPPSSMTNTIDRLVSEDLVERQPHPADRRAATVRLTPRGLELAPKLDRERREHIAEIFGHLNDTETSALIAILESTLNRLLHASDPATPEI